MGISDRIIDHAALRKVFASMLLPAPGPLFFTGSSAALMFILSRLSSAVPVGILFLKNGLHYCRETRCIHSPKDKNGTSPGFKCSSGLTSSLPLYLSDHDNSLRECEILNICSRVVRCYNNFMIDLFSSSNPERIFAKA